ncbi:SpoIIE family protein phosphatase [Streptomyces sp. NPDC047706]|uniref:SpoIIE family protein phosphatase n=1 Tax=Streptomyces sp. NPDC047706 TaxID=3365486 RepID=UPI00371AD8E9
MTSDPAIPAENGTGSGKVTAAGSRAVRRAEGDRLRDLAATSAVLERAKGAVMARTGCSADAAHQELLRRARAGDHTLIEECRLTLGGDSSAPPGGTPGTSTAGDPATGDAPVPGAPVTAAPDATGVPSPVPGARGTPASGAPGDPDAPPTEASDAPSPPVPGTTGPVGTAPGIGTAHTAGPSTPGTTGTDAPTPPGLPLAGRDCDPADDVSAALGRLGRALVGVRGTQELAGCLLEHLSRTVAADAVMIFARLPTDGLELVGHAGIDATLAAQWRHVPPLTGIAALDTLRTREARWLEDLAVDRERFLLIGGTPEQWRSRAWLPVVTDGTAEISIGVLRTRPGPFTPTTREHLRAVVRLCAGRLRAFGPPPEPATAGIAGTVQTVFDTLPGAAMLLTPLRAASGEVEDYRIDAVTPEAVDVVGRIGRELVGLRILECWPPIADESLWRRCQDVLSAGKPYEGAPFAQQDVVAGSAETSTYSVRVARLGDRLVVSWVRHDPSDRQEQRLADVQRLGRLGWASWNLVSGDITWSAQVFTVLDRDPAHGPVRLPDLPGLALPQDAPSLTRAIEALVGEGRPADVPFRIRTARGVRHLRTVAETVADLQGRPVEVHGFLQDLTAQRNAELALVRSERQNLTQHGALQAERVLAARLQHALLPLPDKPLRLAGLRVEVTYLPAQSGIHVGGDWFSAIELPDGTALFVVGDVAGHGIDAVATMAQLRFTAKGMVITGSSLTAALSGLNTLLLHSRDPHGTATMVLAHYHPDERRLVWAQAGHPPPLLLRAGEVRRLGRPGGMLLGASTTPAFEQIECRLEPGDRLLLYTDGLVERPSEAIDRGIERLARALLSHHTDEPGSLGPLLTAVLERERRDDVCVVDIRVPADLT